MKKKLPKQNVQQAFNQLIFDTMMDKLRAVELYEKEVAGYSKQLSQHVKDHQNNSRIVDGAINDLIKKVEALAQNEPIWNVNKRLPEIVHRIDILEKAKEDDIFPARGRLQLVTERVAGLEEANAALWEKGTEQDEGIKSLLAMLTDVEILKTQMVDLHPISKWMNRILEHNHEIAELKKKVEFERKWYHDRIDYLEGRLHKQIDENAAAHIQQSDTIMHMQEQIKGLENRLSRAQDMIAECHPSGCIKISKESKKAIKTCANCKNALEHGLPCTLFNTRCLQHRLWCERKPAGRPKKAKK